MVRVRLRLRERQILKKFGVFILKKGAFVCLIRDFSIDWLCMYIIKSLSL